MLIWKIKSDLFSNFGPFLKIQNDKKVQVLYLKGQNSIKKSQKRSRWNLEPLEKIATRGGRRGPPFPLSAKKWSKCTSHLTLLPLSAKK